MIVAGALIDFNDSLSTAISIISSDTQTTVTQTGTVMAIGQNSTGIFSQAGGQRVQIDGSVFAYDAALFMQGGADADQITIGATGSVTGGSGIQTTGDIQKSAIWAISASAAGPSIVNHGSITGEADILGGGATAIVNTKNNNILAGRDTFFNSDSVMNLTNTGLITGNVLLLAGDDVVENFRLIDGDVVLGDDDDFFGGKGGRVSGIVDGGDGNDTVIGGSGDDELADDGGNDRHFGLDGDDFIYTGIGADTIFAGGGDDDVLGGTSADVIFGGSGDDSLDGESGTDEINGNSGDDTIDGGTASDTIDGGVQR